MQAELRILRPRQAKEKIGLGRTKLYDLIRRGELKPIRLGARAIGLYEHELDAWLAAKPLAEATPESIAEGQRRVEAARIARAKRVAEAKAKSESEALRRAEQQAA